MQPGSDRFFFARCAVSIHADAHAVVAEFGNSRRRASDGAAAFFRLRINRGTQSLQPSLAFFIANRGHHEQIARASGRYVEHANRFLTLAATLIFGVVEKLPRRITGEALRAKLFCGIRVTRWLASFSASQVGEDDDRKFQPLRAM